MAVLLSQRPTISASDVDLVAIDYGKYLDADETLTGTPTVEELGVATFTSGSLTGYTESDDLSFANQAVNEAAMNILGKQVASGKAVQFKVSGQQAGNIYGVRVTVSTNSTPARTKVVDCLLVTAD